MKAIAVVPGTTRVRGVERPEPRINGDDEVKMRVLRVGVCGTDREEVGGGRCKPPAGSEDLVIGHEMLGRVVEVGSAATRVKVGDLAVFTVRRGCGACLPCAMNRSDMCLTGGYHERGIWGLDGYQSEYAVDREQYVVHVAEELGGLGVLLEPMSVAQKAIDEAVRVQMARLPGAPAHLAWLRGRRCLVAGLGPIGLLAAVALRLRGAEVWGLDVVDADSARPRWLTHIGGNYVDGRKVDLEKWPEGIGAMELIFDATGVAKVEFDLLRTLGLNGVYVLTGIPGGARPLEVDAISLIDALVLKNQVMLGSVNAARDHFQLGADDLRHAQLLWGDHINRLITDCHSHDDFASAFGHHGADEIKSVIEWAPVS